MFIDSGRAMEDESIHGEKDECLMSACRGVGSWGGEVRERREEGCSPWGSCVFLPLTLACLVLLQVVLVLLLLVVVLLVRGKSCLRA